jgi:hypothetical protein
VNDMPNVVPLPRFGVDAVVLYRAPALTVLARVKSSRMVFVKGKPTSQWEYHLDTPGLSEFVPEVLLFKVPY